MTPRLLKKLLSAYPDFVEDLEHAEEMICAADEKKAELYRPATSFKTEMRFHNPVTVESIIIALVDQKASAEKVYQASSMMLDYLDSVIENLPEPEKSYAIARYKKRMTLEGMEKEFSLSARAIDYRITVAIENFLS